MSDLILPEDNTDMIKAEYIPDISTNEDAILLS